MELRDAIRTNGTVRRFTADPVERSTVLSILDDARFASSGGNRQPWKVAIVEDRALRRELAVLMQPVWDEYLEPFGADSAPFNAVDWKRPASITPGKPNELLNGIESVPVVLAVAADLRKVALMDGQLDRPAILVVARGTQLDVRERFGFLKLANEFVHFVWAAEDT